MKGGRRCMEFEYKKWIYRTVCMMALLIAVSSCNIDVDLCTETEHPHLSGMTVDFAWNHPDVQKPDSMFVWADRVINRWQCGMAVSTDNMCGKYLFNAPHLYNSDEGNEGQKPVDGEPVEPDESEEKDVVEMSEQGIREFKIRVGEYKMLAFSRNESSFIYYGIPDSTDGDSSLYGNRDLYVEYKAYNKNDQALHKLIDEWSDYNPYSQYIQPDIPHVYCDMLDRVEMKQHSTVNCLFTPRPITQDVEIRFNITKTGNKLCTIDSVVAEISGIPYRVNLLDGHLDVSKTYKMMFGMELWNEGFSQHLSADDSNRKTIGCCAHIHVTSIVSNNSNNMVIGPGILQVFIFASIHDGEVRRKKIQGKINLWNTINNANLISIDVDGKYAVRNKESGKLLIRDNLVIDGNEIIENADNGSGIDKWMSCKDDIILDI